MSLRKYINVQIEFNRVKSITIWIYKQLTKINNTLLPCHYINTFISIHSHRIVLQNAITILLVTFAKQNNFCISSQKHILSRWLINLKFFILFLSTHVKLSCGSQWKKKVSLIFYVVMATLWKKKRTKKMDVQNMEKVHFNLNLPRKLHIHFVCTVFSNVFIIISTQN